MPDLHLAALESAYRSNQATPVDVVRSVYARIRQAGEKPVWIHLIPEDEAVRRAESLQRRGPSPDLPLYGVPFAVKDNIDVAGVPTTAGCPAYAYTPSHTAPVVERLLEAGAILIGKTNLDQFATGLVGTRSPYGACRSVFDDRYISGGSSSGSAVAVALGLVSFSLGTDTAGSGRVPAAFNNIVGLKPSRGLLSARGVVPACRSLDCVSIFALNCSDAQQVFRCARGFDALDGYSRVWASGKPGTSLTGLRVGVPRADQLEFFGDTAAATIYQKSVGSLRQQNAHVVEIDYRPFREAAELLYQGPWVAERLAAIQTFALEHADDMNPVVGKIIAGAAKYTAVDTFSAMYRLQDLRQKTAPVWSTIDTLLLPTTGTTYKIAEVEADPIRLNSNLGYYTNFVNLLDLSALAVPAGIRPDSHLPFGVTLISPAMHDEALLAWGDALHRSLMQYVGNDLSALSSTPRVAVPSLPEGMMPIAVVGAHLSGQPLNRQFTERGAILLRTVRTTPDYRFYALANTTPPKPGLVREPGFRGPGIEVEVWAMPQSHVGSFLSLVPPPLAIGTLHLADGESVHGFLVEPAAVQGSREITEFGGWRGYLASLK